MQSGLIVIMEEGCMYATVHGIFLHSIIDLLQSCKKQEAIIANSIVKSILVIIISNCQ